MADWKVSAEKIEIFAHPDPTVERMAVGKLGMFQIVIGKDNGYQNGDIIVFAPKRSILPEELHGEYKNADTGNSYLVGDDHNRVSSIRLRGALSEGITLPLPWVLAKLGLSSVNELTIGENISSKLDISMYEAPIPDEFKGKAQQIKNTSYRTHDVESSDIYGSEFVEGEIVYATEKVNGSQVWILVENDGSVHVSCKGMAAKGIELLEEASSIYWRAAHNSGVLKTILEQFPGKHVQAFGEVIPVQHGNWKYGVNPNIPSLVLFGLLVDNVEYTIPQAKELPVISNLWVPVLYHGPYDIALLRSMAKGKEQVSGKELHKREGFVVSPEVPRNSSEGWRLYVKYVASDFKGSDDELS